MTTASIVTDDEREEIVGNLRAVIADVEELLDATSSPSANERMGGTARARFQATLRSAREKLAGVDQAVIDKTRDYAQATDDYVRMNPWSAVGIAAVASLLLGVLVSPRR